MINIKNNCIKKYNIIKKKKDFNYILNKKKIILKTLYINVFFLINNLYIPRIGIIIKKKYVKLSVKRNKIKRLIKEYFRKNKIYINNLDLLFILNKDINDINLNYKINIIFEKLKKKIKLWNI